MSFAKLDSGIVNSTLWVLPDDVLRVWIWLLSQADANGVVRTAAPALALVCMKSVDRIREIMLLLESPDPDSRSDVEEGRRLLKIPGGWQIINYRAYRERVAADEKRENDRIRIAEKRAAARETSPRVAGCSEVSQPVAEVAQAEAEAEAEKRKDQGASPYGDTLPAEPKSDPIPYLRIVTEFNRIMVNLPKVRDITANRKTAIRVAWQASESRQSVEFWTALFEEYADDPFLNGTGPYKPPHENWRPDFDHLLKPKVITKVYERAMDRLERAA